MNADQGYVAIAHPSWCQFCFENKLETVNIWMRRSVFKVINPGEPVFFLEKGTRIIRGYGIYKEFKLYNVRESWEKLTISNGAKDFSSFLELLNCKEKEASLEKNLGNILVQNVAWFNKEITMELLGIDFHKAIVSGKRISKEELTKILSNIE